MPQVRSAAGAGSSFDSCVDHVLKLLRAYNSEDVATALFVSDLWLPNVAAMLRHQLAVAAYASLRPEDFAASGRITTYEDFSLFLEELYDVLPPFPSLEDYVPTPDWGEVRFHYEGVNYRIFFECEIEDVYDWLTSFRMLYTSLDAEYVEQVGRSPARELHLCLELQHAVISSISTQPKGEELDVPYPGYLGIPPAGFWDVASAMYREFRPETLASPLELQRYSIRLGSVRRASLEYSAFVDAFFSGELLPCFFVVERDRYLPVLPRRWSCVLLSTWGRILDECLDRIDAGTERYSLHLADQLVEYLGQRIDRRHIVPFVGAVTDEGKPHAAVFAAAVLSEDKSVLVHVTKPATSAKLISAELSAISPSLQEAIELMRASPLRLALPAEDRTVEFHRSAVGDVPEPVMLVVVPVASLQPGPVPIPESFPGRVVPLDQFLGMVDEMTDASDIASFLEYLKAVERKLISPVTGMLDLFASFKETHGLLVGGAREPTGILVDPHWASHMRYKTLAEFWSLYPEVHFFDEPRSWTLERETPSRLRLTARGYLGSAIHWQIGRTHLFTVAPFDRLSFEQAQIADLLMQCLEDAMSGFSRLVDTHAFFRLYDHAEVHFFPDQLVADDPGLSHMRHLEPSDVRWCSDIGFVKGRIPGVRLVFHETLVAQALETACDRSFEIDLLMEVLTRLNEVVPDHAFDKIANEVQKHRSGKPRFMVHRLEKEVSFPDFVPTHKPSTSHCKTARKEQAELAAHLGVEPGSYELEEAKTTLNGLRARLVQAIDRKVSQYSYAAAVPYLLERIDALNHEHERAISSVRCSLEHEVDYDRQHTSAREHTEYIGLHRDLRYLVEKFVQLEPQGSLTLDKERFQSLLAAAGVLQGLYMASDAIHYDIHAVGLEINDDWLVEVQYEPRLKSMELQYAREQAALDLGQAGCPDDRVDYVTPLGDYMDDLDAAFMLDMGFTLTHLWGVLRVLSEWTAFNSGVEENTWYSADKGGIDEVCVHALDGLHGDEVEQILEFLTLRPPDVTKLAGEDEPCDDVPVWEHWKRAWRYNLRPLIAVGAHLFWGPHSARKSGIIWSHVPSERRLPADIPAPSVLRVLVAEKRRAENALVAKASEILGRHAEYVHENVRLHKRDKEGDHPEELGDYDVLAFDPNRNLVLNVECKDISAVYCLKDARRLRQRIFGRVGDKGGYVGRVERRHEHLCATLPRVASALGWPVNTGGSPRVVSFFVCRERYWWTRFPPRPTDVIFSRVDMVAETLAQL